jgi:hypothetical protein
VIKLKIKTRHEVLNDIILEAKKHPSDWMAVFGKDKRLLSDDYYILNPSTGIYIIKEYQRNPFDIKGLGGKITTNINDEIEGILHKKSGEFGIMQGNIQKILRNLESGVQPRVIFDAALKGDGDMGLRMPIKGPASISKKSFGQLRDIVSSKQKKLDSKFERMSADDGIYKSYE